MLEFKLVNWGCFQNKITTFKIEAANWHKIEVNVLLNNYSSQLAVKGARCPWGFKYTPIKSCQGALIDLN